jgi:transposase
MAATTRFNDPVLPDPPALYLAFELSNRSWKLAFSSGLGQKPRMRSIPARDLQALTAEITAARARLRLPESAPLISCYEAGRDGFWLHRFLSTQPGTFNLIVDSASIEVKRRRRHLKTDRIDALKLLSMLIRYHNGEFSVWSVVNVPSPQTEDARNLHRELVTLKSDRTSITNRIKGLLAAQGLSAPSMTKRFPNELRDLRLWDGTPLCPELRQRLEREWLHRSDVSDRIRLIEKIQTERLESSDEQALALVRQLMTIKGVGLQSAWLFTFEFFAWRNIQNRRQLAALCGFTPTPYQSGDESLDQGISKAGSSLVRAMTIQIAWGWLHFQPDSALTLWFQRGFANGGRRMRAIGIVAVARRLLIELWRFLETGTLPEGAVTSPP